MKRSEINQSENSFGIKLSNKCQMSINNVTNNAVMIGSVISSPIHPNSSILSTALNSPRTNLAPLAKPSSSSVSFSAIKLVNLSKCQQLPNMNKVNPNAANNSINVQFVTPIINTTLSSLNDSTNLTHSMTKLENSSINNIASVLLTSSASQSMATSNNSITCTRFILHSSQAPILPHGTVTIIPQHSDISTSGLLNNQLIKNARYALTGVKQSPQAIRPISASSASVTSHSTVGKQSISKITPKSVNNYTLMSEGVNTIAIQDLRSNSRAPLPKDQRSATKSTPIKPINCTITSSNNIRLALTSSITNSKVNVVNPTKIQLISPKSRKRSGSPNNIPTEGKISNEPLLSLKDENMENPLCYNSQSGGYSPARKRARKQHLKAANNKLQKLGTNNTRYDVTSVINSRTTTKVANITTQIKAPEVNISTLNSVSNSVSPQIIIPMKNSIHINSSKPSSNITSLLSNHLTVTSGTFHSSTNQVQIISQIPSSSSSSFLVRPPIQLSPNNHNLILSPKFTKTITSFSPQKVIHIAPSKIIYSQSDVKSENVSQTFANSVNKEVPKKDNESLKVEVVEVKSEESGHSNLKYSLFPYKYHWNSRRNHFEKKCDVKIKKRKCASYFRQSNSESPKDMDPSSDVDIDDTSWRLYKVCNQLMMQKSFEEENLKIFHKLKEKYEVKPLSSQNEGGEEPVFERISPDPEYYKPLPDQIGSSALSEFTDPRWFGISEDINTDYINVINAENILSSSSQATEESDEAPLKPHLWGQEQSNLSYVTEKPPFSPPSHILRIIDLIEGLIVKEKKIIDKESEINDQCLRLLQTSEVRHQHVNNYVSERTKVPNERRW